MFQIRMFFPFDMMSIFSFNEWNLLTQCLSVLFPDNYNDLLQLLREMSPVEYSSSIKNWDIGGKLYLDYITMNQTIDEIKNVGVFYEYKTKLEYLLFYILSVHSTITNLGVSWHIQLLCLSEHPVSIAI